MEKTQKYTDREIVLLKSKVKMQLKNELIGKRMEMDGFSIIIPEGFSDMSEIEKYAKYPSKKRPARILICRNACFTYSKFIIREDSLLESCQKVKACLMKVYPQNVFYDAGNIQTDSGKIFWFDCKGFCFDGSYYCLIFIFDIKGYRIFGNFHCPFQKYDSWKPLIIDMLKTVNI